MTRNVIDEIRIFKYNTNYNPPRANYIVRISSGNHCGWGECALHGALAFNISDAMYELYGKTVSDAISFVRASHFPPAFIEMVELAMLDLHGNITQKSASELLVINGVKPVLSTATINLKDRYAMIKRMESAVNAGCRAIRFRLSGDPDFDIETVGAIREVLPRDRVYLIGNAAGAYSDALEFSPEKLGIRLLKMYTAGLDVCEDPAEMDVEGWKALQAFVDPMSLSAERILCPSKRAISIADKDMCRIFKLRPGSTGSIYDALQFAEHIKNFGGRIAIGDGTLIGPGCSQWQQIAIALGAEWNECVEMAPRSDIYDEALKKSPLNIVEGMHTMIGGCPGFGLEIDESILQFYAHQTIEP